MQDHEKPEKQHPRKRDSEPLKPVLIFFVLVLLIVGGTVAFFFKGQEEPRELLESEPLITQEQTQPASISGEMEPDLSTAENIGQVAILPSEDEGEEVAVPGEIAESSEEKRARECRILAEQVHGFFTHVDSEDYIRQFELQNPSQEYFIALAYKLLKNPPVVSRESDDLYTILKNMAHFFRVIGKDNIILMKTILDRERDKIEDVAAELYQWTVWDSCNDDLLQFSPSLEEMYEYAGFFLNTMGGRSYLFRRDSRSRLLVNYYSVLLIEQANKKGINRHGIDISQIIPQLVQEIDSSTQLIYKENYIDSLYALLEKYQ